MNASNLAFKKELSAVKKEVALLRRYVMRLIPTEDLSDYKYPARLKKQIEESLEDIKHGRVSRRL
jgi:hypothetical protein